MSKAYFVILHQKTSIMKIGFDNEKYQKIQSEHIKERISQFDGKQIGRASCRERV